MTESIKSFSELKEFLKVNDKDLELYIYPNLKLGAVFWIPNKESGIDGDGEHPWIIISNYEPGIQVITACLRTTTNMQKNEKRGLKQPAGVLAGLNREGVIVTGMRRSFQISKFRDYRYEGQLPQEWVDKLKKHIAQGLY